VQWLRDGSGNPESGPADVEAAAHHQNIGRSITETLPGAVDLSQPMRLEFRRGLIPYRGRVMAGKEGYLNFSGAEPTEYIEAPPGLAEVEGAYAVRVVDRSMLPVLKPGMVCCVDPRLEPMAEDECIVQLTDDDGVTVHGFVKRFLSMNNRVLRVQQFNPEKIIEIPRKRVFAVHRVVWSGRPY
jgi:phage repressor protein C with HTH and peptisase S24 domain